VSDLDDLKKEGSEADASGDNAPQWKPEKDGDQLAGNLTKIDMVNTPHGDAHVLTIKDEAGESWALWLGKVLLSKFLDAAPPIDALVVVTFKGEMKGKSGYTYKVFDMRCDPKGAYDEWNQVATVFLQKKQLLEAQAVGGSGLAPDSAAGLEPPF